MFYFKFTWTFNVPTSVKLQSANRCWTIFWLIWSCTTNIEPTTVGRLLSPMLDQYQHANIELLQQFILIFKDWLLFDRYMFSFCIWKCPFPIGRLVVVVIVVCYRCFIIVVVFLSLLFVVVITQSTVLFSCWNQIGSNFSIII